LHKLPKTESMAKEEAQNGEPTPVLYDKKRQKIADEDRKKKSLWDVRCGKRKRAIWGAGNRREVAKKEKNLS